MDTRAAGPFRVPHGRGVRKSTCHYTLRPFADARTIDRALIFPGRGRFRLWPTIYGMSNNDSTSTLLDALPWRPDILGEGFEAATLTTPDTPEHATLVRALPDAPTGKPALLWIHGMSDYFFQAHVAEHFLAQGHPFYAIDLRRCGRSRQDGEYWHYTTDLAEYFPELNEALRLVAAKHHRVVPVAHSTGGLIAALWLDHLRRERPAEHAAVAGLLLDSPWLDMQFPPLVVRALRGPVSVLGKRFPGLKLPKSGTGTYGESISASAHGRWEFDTDMKPISGHLVRLGWLRAIFRGQEEIHSGVDTGVPTLTLCSSHSYLNKPYSAAADTADTVLDVEQIRRWAPTLAQSARVETINGALHDVFLSEPHPREAAFHAADAWLEALPAGN